MSTSVPPPAFASPAPPPAGVTPPERNGRWMLGAGLFALAATVAAAAAFLLLGSGGGGLSGPIAQAATVSSRAAGYRMHMSLVMTSTASGSPITASGNGIVDLRDHASSMSISMSFGDDPRIAQALGGSTLRMKMVMDGGAVYMRLPAIAAVALPTGGKPWMKLDLSKLAGVPGLSSLESNPTTSDPSQMLQYLPSASDVVLDEGRDTVDGFETTHYQAEVNLSHLVGRLGGAGQQALSKLSQLLPSGDLPIDVWIDSHDLVRRIAMTLNLGLPSGPSLHESVISDLSHYGPQPRPTPPPADQVQDLSGLASGA